MAGLGNNVFLKQRMDFPASTDMGNVSYHVPSFHGTFVASTLGVPIHSPKFTAEAATDEAHAATIECGKGMAMLALRVLTDDQVATGAREDFEKS
jgi:metal-dependent amidase/aminoacylase/carboxypeptidase family protein